MSRASVVVVAFMAMAATVACGDLLRPDGDPMDDEAFVEVYVDLRVAALRSPSGQIDPDDRQRILEEHGVVEEDLVEFVEAHSADIHRMRDIWEEASDRLNEMRETGESSEEEAEGEEGGLRAPPD